MTAITLQKKLMKKISETDNISTLKIIEKILQEDEKPVKLTEFQKS